MMFKIRNVDFLYDNENNVSKVHARYDGNTTSSNMNVSGFVELTVEEYMTNAADLSALATLVKQKLTTELNK